MFVTERYQLPQSVKDDLQSRPINWGFGMFSQAVYYRTYSREMADGSQEHWPDTVIRVVEGVGSIRKDHYKKFGIPWDDDYWTAQLTQMAYAIFDMRFLPPGRGLWTMGAETVYEEGSAFLQNCGFTDTTVLSEDAAWCMDMLMCGVGIGFNGNPNLHQPVYTKPGHPAIDFGQIAHLQDQAHALRADIDAERINQDEYDRIVTGIKPTQHCVHIIPDTRQGWFESVRTLIRSYEDKIAVEPHFVYDFIRPAGRPIGGFGGLSSGPEPLVKLHYRLRNTLDRYVAGDISQTEMVADVFTQIGCCVVAGNVRRSAELAVGSVRDEDFINLKNYAAKPDRQEWGWMSNNSVALWNTADFDHLPQIAAGIRDNGEPGVLNMLNVQKYARYGKKKYDPAIGFNPCAEQPLQDKELCTLVEVFPTRNPSYQEHHQATRLATLYAQTVTLLPTHDARTNLVMQQNRRIGVSQSGIADWLDATSLSTIHTTLDNLYEKCVEPWSAEYARESKVPTPIRITTVKPSGTISNLVGVSPGMHHPTFRWGIRRMRVSDQSPLVEMLDAAGVYSEPDAYSDNTLVFEFPIEMGMGNTRPINEVSIWEQASMVAFLQRVWSDNAVSNTLVFSPSREGDQIERVIATFAPLTKSLSLLPDQEEQQSYVQAPYERTSREVYRERSRDIQEIDWSSFGGTDGIDTRFCDGDNCDVEF